MPFQTKHTHKQKQNNHYSTTQNNSFGTSELLYFWKYALHCPFCKIRNILHMMQNMQYVSYFAKYAMYFAHILLTTRGGRRLRRPPLLVYIMCTKYIAYFAKYETYCMFCIMCNMLRILQNGQCDAYFSECSDVSNFGERIYFMFSEV